MAVSLKTTLMVVVIAVSSSPVSRADITGTLPAARTCLCVVGASRKVVSDFECGKLVRQLKPGPCYEFTGLKETCQHVGTDTIELFQLDDGRGSWVSGDQVMPADDQSSCRTNRLLFAGDACPRIVSRAEWRARAPRSVVKIKQPIPRVFIHHTETPSCNSQETCGTIVRSIQNYHMDNKGWGDIGYNFLVGEDGNAYEGRGWDNVGAQVKDYNSVSLGIAVIGNYTGRQPAAAALSTVQQLIACSVTKGKLASDYKLHGHRDGGATNCPGDKLYNLIRTWPHFAGPIHGTSSRAGQRSWNRR